VLRGDVLKNSMGGKRGRVKNNEDVQIVREKSFVGFFFAEKGLMADVTVERAKFTKIRR